MSRVMKARERVAVAASKTGWTVEPVGDLTEVFKRDGSGKIVVRYGTTGAIQSATIVKSGDVGRNITGNATTCQRIIDQLTAKP